MPSTYTLNNGIELIGTGEQSGTWGDTTNTNLGLLDAALDGQVTITLAAAGSSGSPNALPITDGTTSNGRNRMVVFADGGDLGATAYVQLTPNDAEKIIYIRNSLSGSRSVILFQGTYNASNDYEVPAGTTAVVYFDGAGAGAVAANVFNNAYFDGLRLGSVSVTAILDEDNMASDSATALATQQSIKAYVDSQVGTVDTLAEILAIGNTTGATDIAVDSAQKVQFRDAAIYINSSVDGQLDIVADTEIQIAATTIDVNGALDVSGTALVTGVLTTTAATVSNGGGQFNGAINVGVDDTGYDVKFFGATTGKSLLWDESADSLIVTGTTTLVGTTNLDAVDIDGATQIDATVTVGVDDTGYDVKFFGDTASAYMLWDASADDLILGGAAGLSVNSTALVTGVLTTTAATVFNGGFASNANSTVGGTLITTGNMSISETGADNEKSLTIANSSVSGAFIGVEGSGGNRFSGSAVNNMFIGTTSADGLEFATSNTVRANIAANGAASFNGVLTANAGVVVDNFTLDGTTLALSSGEFVLDVASAINFNSDTGNFRFQDAAVDVGIIQIASSDFIIRSLVSDKDIIFQGNDGGSTITALTLDMSAAGNATFNSNVLLPDNRAFVMGASSDFQIYHESSVNIIQAATSNQDIVFKGNDGGSTITALTLDMSEGGYATFNNGMTLKNDIYINNADGSLTVGYLYNDSNDFIVRSYSQDKDIIFKGNDGGSLITALTLDMSDGGNATFNKDILLGDDSAIRLGASQDLALFHDATDSTIRNNTGDLILDVAGDIILDAGGSDILLKVAGTTFGSLRENSSNFRIKSDVSDKDILFLGNDGGVEITALTLDMSSAGNATFNGTVLASSGTNSLPSLSFSGDPNTGIYNSSADNIGFAIGGVARAFMSANQFNMTGNGVFSGSISKGSGSFKIDHPLPEKAETHHLVHSFVESPQADNIYRGKVDLVDGSATVNIDDAAGMTDGTFAVLNREVQCFTSNETGWTAVRGSVSGNILTIEAQDASCTDTISWMVIGERQDKHMYDTEWTDENGKVIVEPLKEK
jgi:hypothetical protein